MILEKSEIVKYLPQRVPFLMVDRVVDYTAARAITAELDIPETLPFFKGHFPSMPIMPGVLMVEAMAQTSGLLIALTAKENGDDKSEKVFYLASNNVKFKSVVHAGGKLVMKSTLVREFEGLFSFSAEVYNGREVAASGTIVLASGKNVRL